jgi:hypothetical protein
MGFVVTWTKFFGENTLLTAVARVMFIAKG